jgi:CBS-domain-containing membrane protein
MVPQVTIWSKLRTLWKYYLLQTFLAAGSLAFMVFLFGQEKTVLISSMGATTFILFAMPKTVSAKTRNVIGGHLVGIASGAVLYLTGLPYYLSYPLAVGVAMFLMVALDVEHPPAAGTAMAVVTHEVSSEMFAVVMLCAVVLSQVRYFLRHRLRDLI